MFNKVIDIVNLLANISMIVITIYIAHRVEKSTKQQDKKILEDNKINRLANLYSSIRCINNDQVLIRKDMNSLDVLSEYSKMENVMIYDDMVKKKDCSKALEFSLSLESLTHINPTQILVKNANLLVAREYELTLFKKYENFDGKYKSVSLYDKNKILLPILFSLNEEDAKKIQNVKINGINIIMYLQLKNQFNIITDCEITCTFIPNSENNLKWILKDTYLKINI